MADLFGPTPDEVRRKRLIDLGWLERLYPSRSGEPSRFWVTPTGQELPEHAAFAWLDATQRPPDAPLPDGETA